MTDTDKTDLPLDNVVQPCSNVVGIDPTKPWKKRAYLFLISQSITLFGSTLVQMAIIWYVTLATSSGKWVAAFTICSYLPQFLISFAGGVWADRYNRKMLIIASDAAIALATMVMVVLMPYIKPEPYLLVSLLLVSVVRSLGAGIQTPAVNAQVPLLVPEDYLMKYNGFNATMQSLVQFAAPAAAGAIMSFSTLRLTMLVDVGTALLGIGLLSFLLLPKVQKLEIKESSMVEDMKSGLKYAFSHQLLGKILTIYGLFIFFTVPGGFMAGLLVSRVYGNTYWYLTAMEVVGFLGMALGGLLMSSWGGFDSRVKTISLGLGCFGVLCSAMGLATNFIFYLSAMLLFGVALTTVQTAITTLIQEKAQVEMQGRVFGLMSTMYAGFLPLGMALFGPVADIVPLQTIMVITGLALVLIGLFSATNKSLKGC